MVDFYRNGEKVGLNITRGMFEMYRDYYKFRGTSRDFKHHIYTFKYMDGHTVLVPVGGYDEY